LYYRLNVLTLRLPPLRERCDDIMLLARHFLAKYAHKFERPAKDFSSGARRKLARYDWPGNVRELEHAVERSVALCEDVFIRAAHLDLPGDDETPQLSPPMSFHEAKARHVEKFERGYLEELLRLHRGNITRAARAARKDRRALWQLIRKHRID